MSAHDVLLELGQLARVESAQGDLTNVPRALASLDGASRPTLAAIHLLLEVRVATHAATTMWENLCQRARSLAETEVETRAIVAEACADGIMTGILGWDAKTLRAWLGVFDGLAHGAWPDGLDTTRAIGQHWLELLEGRDASVALDVAQPAAASAAPLLAGLQAIVLSAKDTADALDLARSAVRLAADVRHLASHTLVHVVLARLRRRSGRPHLARHILGSIAKSAPVSARPWIAWESFLCGGRAHALALLEPFSPSDAPTAARVTWRSAEAMTAAERGDGPAWRRAILSLAAVNPGGLLGEEARLVAPLIEETNGDRESTALAEWVTGARINLPLGLEGLAFSDDVPANADRTLTFVVAAPGARGRRVLRPGLPLAPRFEMLPTTEDAPATVRTDTALAVLALAGPDGLERGTFFRAVYGFAFVANRHQGVLDTLVHRLRARLGAAGTIHRDADRGTIGLELHRPLALADLRAELPVADRVLRTLVALGTGTARGAAEALGLPLRTVQEAVQQLVSEGACVVERHGRHLVYRAHDTTFRNPPDKPPPHDR